MIDSMVWWCDMQVHHYFTATGQIVMMNNNLHMTYYTKLLITQNIPLIPYMLRIKSIKLNYF